MHADNLKVTSKIKELECMASKTVEEKKKEIIQQKAGKRGEREQRKSMINENTNKILEIIPNKSVIIIHMSESIISHLSKWRPADWLFKSFMGNKNRIDYTYKYIFIHTYVYVCMNQSPNLICTMPSLKVRVTKSLSRVKFVIQSKVMWDLLSPGSPEES